VTQITELARGMVASDELVVRLVEPDGHPETVIIVWPDHATVAKPALRRDRRHRDEAIGQRQHRIDAAPACPPPSLAGP
jgi:hypothetical protein